MITRAPLNCYSDCPNSGSPIRSAQEFVNTPPILSVPRPEPAVLVQIATSAGWALMVHSLWPFKWPEQQSRTSLEGKIRHWNTTFFHFLFVCLFVFRFFPPLQLSRTADQMCLFGRVSFRWPDATMRLFQMDHVITPMVTQGSFWIPVLEATSEECFGLYYQATMFPLKIFPSKFYFSE